MKGFKGISIQEIQELLKRNLHSKKVNRFQDKSLFQKTIKVIVNNLFMNLINQFFLNFDFLSGFQSIYVILCYCISSFEIR